jgi:hypothetical protein
MALLTLSRGTSGLYRPAWEAQTAKRQTITLFLGCVTTNPFLAVEACYGPPTLGQVVVHTADVAPPTSNSEAYRSVRRPVSRGMAGSVGACGLLTDGQTYPQTVGGKPKQIAVLDVICGRYPPPTGCMWHLWEGAWRRNTRATDHPVGNSVGAIG